MGTSNRTLSISRADFLALVNGAFGVFCLALGVYSLSTGEESLGLFAAVGVFWLVTATYYHLNPESISRGSDGTPRRWAELVVVVVVSVLLGSAGLFVLFELV